MQHQKSRKVSLEVQPEGQEQAPSGWHGPKEPDATSRQVARLLDSIGASWWLSIKIMGRTLQPVCKKEVSGGGTCEEAQLAQGQEGKTLPKGPKVQGTTLCAS